MQISVGHFLHVLVIKPKDVFSHSYDIGQAFYRPVVDQS